MFASDNATAVCPEVLAAIVAANDGDATPYGGDLETKELERRFSDYFEKEVTVLPVATGTAANALSLALMTPRFGAIYCHESAHIQTTECGASEFWSQGGKLLLLPGPDNRIDPYAFVQAMQHTARGRIHNVQPAGISITQGTDVGTVYPIETIAAITKTARQYGLYIHMDGARFSNALARLRCKPADLTWRAGIDILSYGATKNGAMCADAIVIFRKELATQAGYARVRAGQLFSKMRYLSSQLGALTQNGAATRNAVQANAMAKRLADGLLRIRQVQLRFPVEINMIFIELPDSTVHELEAAGYALTPRIDAKGRFFRLVCAWNTEPEAVDAFVQAAARG